jgi:YVTN family beta-propeller protein
MTRVLTALLALGIVPAGAADRWCSPSSAVASPDGRSLYLACTTGARIDVLDTATSAVTRTIRTPGPATGLALSADAKRLYVTCAAPQSRVAVIDPAAGRLLSSIATGHTSHSPALSPDGKLLYVPNRHNDDVSVIDLARGIETVRLKAQREPESAAPTADGRFLFVANGLPAGRADVDSVASEISVIDLTARKQVRAIRLPSGSTGLHDLRISPDGKLACVAHLVGRYQLPTTQVERGWMETNAISLIDVATQELAGTALLDEVDRGAANPWAVAWTANSARLLVTHAGTHEVSLIEVPEMMRRLASSRAAAPNDMSLLLGIRKRIQLAGNGPRAIAIAGNRAWVPAYFSDTVEAIDLSAQQSAPAAAVHLSRVPATALRRGEMLFNDGSLCFQGWQSCASCHGPDARVDGLNWDLLNDGIGNPKNVKSLLLAHRTPPAMSQHVREDAEAAVRAGLRHILFAESPEPDALAIDEWLKSLRPIPSPHLVKGKPNAAADRGRKLFNDRTVGCASCHPAGLSTDLRPYDVGTRSKTDTVSAFDTPTLVEIWRTAPYLHDGSVPTLREVLTTGNREDRHGKTSHLSPAQIDDLLAYLQTL